MKRTIAVAVTLFLAGAISAEEIVYNKMDQWTHPNSTVTTSLTDKGDGILSAAGGLSLFSTPAVLVDPAKKYSVSGTFRKTAGEEAPVYFGWAFFDKDGRYFDNAQVNAVKGSDTELLEALEKGGRELIIKEGSGWSHFQGKYIACNTDPSYKDLPNFNLITEGIESVKQVDGKWVVTLKNPSKTDLPVGTKVRLHQPGGTVYFADNRKPKDRWITFKSGPVSGISAKPGLSAAQFPVGTARVKILIFLNYGKKSDTITEFKNIKLMID